jgi:hypothetical protein
MEFSYIVSEEAYLRACSIPVKSLGLPKMGWVKWVYQSLMFLSVWGAVVAGMIVTTHDSQFGVAAGAGVPFSTLLLTGLYPALVIWFLYSLIMQIVHPRLSRVNASRLRVYRSDPSCHCETTLTLTPERVRFQCSEECFTQSGWNTYDHWVESKGILLLVTRSGARRIVNLNELSEGKREELREILMAALPKR